MIIQGGGTNSDDTGLITTAQDLDWSNRVKVDATSFADATAETKIAITYVENNDTDYCSFKMMSGDDELFAGTPDGFLIDTTSENANDLHGCKFIKTPSTSSETVSYKPTEEEWAKIKVGGFELIGHGAKITKIVCE